MLAQEYQNYIHTIYRVAGAYIKAHGRFSSAMVLNHSLTRDAAAESYAYTLTQARYSAEDTAKYVNDEIAKLTFTAVKDAHSKLKRQGLAALSTTGASGGTTSGVVLAAISASVVGTSIAAKQPAIHRRNFLAGLSAATFAGGLALAPQSVQAGTRDPGMIQAIAMGDVAYWSMIYQLVIAFLAMQYGAIALAITR